MQARLLCLLPPGEWADVSVKLIFISHASRNAALAWKKDCHPFCVKPRSLCSLTSKIVHREFVPYGTTINAKYYVGVLKRLKRRLRCIRPDIAGIGNSTLATRQPTPPVPWHASWSIQRCQRFPSRPTVLTWLLQTFLFFALENFHERTSFWGSWQSRRGLHQGSKRHSTKDLLWRLRSLDISLEAMYWRRRSVFWHPLMRCTDLIKKLFSTHWHYFSDMICDELGSIVNKLVQQYQHIFCLFVVLPPLLLKDIPG